eukprot:SAG25_NODE_49_length_18832_cov_5.265841_2_plen_2407_part_00
MCVKSHVCACSHGSGEGLNCITPHEQRCSSCDSGYAPDNLSKEAAKSVWHNTASVRVSSVPGFESDIIAGVNLALRRPVTVSSECNTFKPTGRNFLTDGDYFQGGCPGDRYYWQACQACRETAASTSSWARVTLDTITRVRRIVIWPRCDRNSNEMAGSHAEVLVGNTWTRCGRVIAPDVTIRTKTGFTFDCDLKGSAVRVTKRSNRKPVAQRGEYMSLSEIQVFDTSATAQLPVQQAMGVYVASIGQTCHHHPVYVLQEGVTLTDHLEHKQGAKVITGPGVTSKHQYAYIDMNTSPETYKIAPQGRSLDCNRPLYVTVDLGNTYTVASITVWNRYRDKRRVCGQKLALSTSGYFSGEETVVMDSKGAYGKPEVAEGSHYRFTPQAARYVRHWMSRSDKSEYAHWIEMAVYGDGSRGAFAMWSKSDNSGWLIGPSSNACRSHSGNTALGWFTSTCGDNMFVCNAWHNQTGSHAPIVTTPLYAKNCTKTSATCSFDSDTGTCGWRSSGSSRWTRKFADVQTPAHTGQFCMTSTVTNAAPYQEFATNRPASYLLSPPLPTGMHSIKFQYRFRGAALSTLSIAVLVGQNNSKSVWVPTGWTLMASQSGRMDTWRGAELALPKGATRLRFMHARSPRAENPVLALGRSYQGYCSEVSWSLKRPGIWLENPNFNVAVQGTYKSALECMKMCTPFSACVAISWNLGGECRVYSTCRRGSNRGGGTWQTYWTDETLRRSTATTLPPPPPPSATLRCGGTVCEYAWTGIGGTRVTDLTRNKRYPNSPNTVRRLTSGGFQMQQRGDNLGAMLEGFVMAPTTGTYTFSTRSDDSSEVWAASRPISQSGLVKVVELNGCCRKVNGNRKLTWTAGKLYYIKALVKEGGGGEYLYVGMKVGNKEYYPIPVSMFRSVPPPTSAAFPYGSVDVDTVFLSPQPHIDRCTCGNGSAAVSPRCPPDPNSCGWTLDGLWAHGSSATFANVSNTGPSQALQGSGFVYLNTLGDAPAGTTSYLTSPVRVGLRAVGFHYHMYGAAQGRLALEVNAKGLWTEVWHKTGQQQLTQAAPWTYDVVLLPKATSQVRFKGTKRADKTGAMSVDTVTFVRPTPQPPWPVPPPSRPPAPPRNLRPNCHSNRPPPPPPPPYRRRRTYYYSRRRTYYYSRRRSGGGKGRRRMLSEDRQPSPAVKPACLKYDAARAKLGCNAPPYKLSGFTGSGVERFAERWLDWMCCRAVSSAPSDWETNVIIWKQICATVLMSTQPKAQFAIRLQELCPTGITDEKLPEWIIATFKPVLEAKNPHWHSTPNVICKKQDPTNVNATATLLLSDANDVSHLELLIHQDGSIDALPAANDTSAFVSWIPGDTPGYAHGYVGWGESTESVARTLTLHGGDAAAMMKEWELIKHGRQVFDIVTFNCAVATMRILSRGFNQVCSSMPAVEWVSPSGVFALAQAISDQLTGGNVNRSRAAQFPQLTVERIRNSSPTFQAELFDRQLAAPQQTQKSNLSLNWSKADHSRFTSAATQAHRRLQTMQVAHLIENPSGAKETPRCAADTEKHEMRCCADKAITGYRRVRCQGKNLWTESDSKGFGGCQHALTYAQSDALCKKMGARLCTASEIKARCTRGTGCQHDFDLLWSNTLCIQKKVCNFDSTKYCAGWSSTGYWRSGSRTPSVNTGPNKPQAGARFRFLECNGVTNGFTSFLYSPSFTKAASVIFYYHMYGINMGTLAVAEKRGQSWRRLWTRTGQQQWSGNAAWRKAVVAIFHTATRIRFIGQRSNGWAGDMAIDSVTISNNPAPPPPAYHVGTKKRLVQKGWNGCTQRNKCSMCVGDCDKDTDCQAGLRCFQRDRNTPVHGCQIGGTGDIRDYDYCYSPTMSLHTYGASGCTPDNKCGACTGDCDNDIDCLDDLKCFQRNGKTRVHGCLGGGKADVPDDDYCYSPTALHNHGWNGCKPSDKCGKCAGDCDKDADCKSGLRCFQRNTHTRVPGCDTGGVYDIFGKDYCYDTASNTRPTGSNSGTAKLPGCRLADVYISEAHGQGSPADYIELTTCNQTCSLLGFKLDDSPAMSDLTFRRATKITSGGVWLGYRGRTESFTSDLSSKGETLFLCDSNMACKSVKLGSTAADGLAWCFDSKGKAKQCQGTPGVANLICGNLPPPPPAPTPFSPAPPPSLPKGPRTTCTFDDKSNICARCNAGFVLTESSCTPQRPEASCLCPNGTAADLQTGCKAGALHHCVKCNQDFLLVGRSCIYCPPGTQFDGTVCSACAQGKADLDAQPRTPCSACSSGRFAPARGSSGCTQCNGYPHYASSPRGSTSASQCIYTIAYTSFEEVDTAQRTGLYIDKLGGDTNHTLQNNDGQHAVSYDACAGGKLELGFQSYCTFHCMFVFPSDPHPVLVSNFRTNSLSVTARARARVCVCVCVCVCVQM